MSQVQKSMSLANPAPPFTDTIQKIAAAVGGIGLLFMILALSGNGTIQNSTWLFTSLSLIMAGTVIYSWRAYMTLPEGIKNNGVWFSSLASKGLWGWILGIVLTGFYVVLYWFPQYLGLGGEDAANTGLVAFFDPLSRMLSGNSASQWFVYGTLYTVAILAFGIKFILKYRHNKYQIIRTISVMFFQLGFAFLIPEIMQKLQYPYYSFTNMWPLNYYFFYDWNLTTLLGAGNVGLFMLLFGLAMVFIISPTLTYFYGKRWYCSWVCGCGGLAETAGDPFRHLSDKSLKAWKIERWMIHGVLVFVTLMTVAVIYSYYTGDRNVLITKPIAIGLIVLLGAFIIAIVQVNKKDINLSKDKLSLLISGIVGVIVLLAVIAYFTGSFVIDGGLLRSWYGFAIGSAFSGVVGVGFYPLMGSRVWCRFGCPMAALLGLQQKFFSRFRITTNGGQCISCGNCSTYCEMGIDVRSYAQKGQNIVRASCVGCGICAAVCPRGVLKLENGSVDLQNKTTELKAIHIAEGDVRIL